MSAGQSQRRVARERRKLCGARLQPHQASASSVGLGSVLHRCASGASLIACPHMLLTVRCLHTWQDRPRDCVRATPQSWALCCQTTRYAHEHVRLVRLHSRTEEHGRRGRARCVSASALNFTSFVRSRARMCVEPWYDLSHSGMAKWVFLCVVYVTKHTLVVENLRTHPYRDRELCRE